MPVGEIPRSPTDWIGISVQTMSIAEVRSLPLREKLQILEAIWEDLSAHVDGMEISPAERALLDTRLDRVRNGETEVHDWDSVKHSLGRQ
jgi:putative addiction module component (TIGR02574 family)